MSSLKAHILWRQSSSSLKALLLPKSSNCTNRCGCHTCSAHHLAHEGVKLRACNEGWWMAH
jgi:hypothetical protein